MGWLISIAAWTAPPWRMRCGVGTERAARAARHRSGYRQLCRSEILRLRRPARHRLDSRPLLAGRPLDSFLRALESLAAP